MVLPMFRVTLHPSTNLIYMITYRHSTNIFLHFMKVTIKLTILVLSFVNFSLKCIAFKPMPVGTEWMFGSERRPIHVRTLRNQTPETSLRV